jgi:molybdate transport system permease protein
MAPVDLVAASQKASRRCNSRQAADLPESLSSGPALAIIAFQGFPYLSKHALTDWLSPDEWHAVALSLRVSLWATVLSLPPGIYVAHLLARKQFVGKSLLNVLVHLPLVLPPVVTGYLLLIAFGRKGLIGAHLDQWFGVVLAFRWTGAVLAAAIMAFPLMVRAISLSFQAVDPKLESAAATLGASRFWVFFTVTMPLALPGILAGAVLAFAKAMGEFGATITFVSNIPGETQTLPSAIYAFLQVPGGNAKAFKLVAISIGIAALALVLVEWLGRVLARRISAT